MSNKTKEIFHNKTLTKHGRKWGCSIYGKKVYLPLDELKKRVLEAQAQKLSAQAAVVGKRNIKIDDAYSMLIKEKEREGKSACTLRNYKYALGRFKKHIKCKWINRITKEVFQSFLDEMKSNELLTVTTHAYALNVMALIRWCDNNNFVVDKRVFDIKWDSGKSQMSGKRGFSYAEEEKVLSYVKGKGAFAYAIILLLRETGCRGIEATRLNVEDLIVNGDDLPIVQFKASVTKTKKYRENVISDNCWRAVKEQLSERKKGDPLLVSSRGARWSTEGLQAIMKRCKKELGLPNDVSLYSFRKSRCMDTSKKHGALAESKLMGHSSDVMERHYYILNSEIHKSISVDLNSWHKNGAGRSDDKSPLTDALNDPEARSEIINILFTGYPSEYLLPIQKSTEKPKLNRDVRN